MQKKILTHLFILSFAVAGLFVVGNNLMAQQVEEKPTPSLTCSGTHDGIGNGYRYCPTCDWVANAHPDSWTAGTCTK
jgi:hypothetical protein